MDEIGIVPQHQFGFRAKHSTIEQAHRVTAKIRNALEAKEFCPAIYLDVQQAFDRVWIPGLLHKMSEYIPMPYTRLLQSYLTDRKFEVHHGEAVSAIESIQAGVPQGSVLGPPLYVLLTPDIPITGETELATFADDTAILASHHQYEKAVANLQDAVTKITEWTKSWKIKLNTNKTVYVMYTLRSCLPTYITINMEQIATSPSAKYLGLNIDSSLNWKIHIEKKREELKLRFRSLFWLIRARSKLSLDNKRLLYVSILRPMWIYGAPIWGCAAKSNIEILQRQQNLIIRKITGTPWYLTNQDLHHDVRLSTVHQVIQKLSAVYEKRIFQHTNILAIQLMDNPTVQRLRRRHYTDLLLNVN